MRTTLDLEDELLLAVKEIAKQRGTTASHVVCALIRESLQPRSVKLAYRDGVPVLPLRDVVVYPHMVIPLFVGREKSILALDAAMRADKRIMLLAQKQADVDDPKIDDLYRTGTVATILQLLKLPDGTVKVLVEGSSRVQVKGYTRTDEYYEADAEVIADDDICYREVVLEADHCRICENLAIRAGLLELLYKRTAEAQ